MGGQGQHVDALGVYVNGQVAHSLNGVGVEGNALFPAQGSNFSDRLDGADFVVGEHDGHQGGVLPDGGGHVLHLYNAAFINGDQGDLKAFFGELVHGMKDSVVLDGGGDEVFFAFASTHLGGAGNGLIVRLAAAGGEVNLSGLGSDGFCHRLPGGLQCLLGLLPGGMEAGGIAPEALHGVQHGLLSSGAGLCGRGVVRIYHDLSISLKSVKKGLIFCFAQTIP